MKEPFSRNDGRVKKQENDLNLFDLLMFYWHTQKTMKRNN